MKAQETLNGSESKNPIRRSNRKKPSPETIKIIVLAAKEKIRVTTDLWWGQEEGKTVGKKKEKKKRVIIPQGRFTQQIHVTASPTAEFILGPKLCSWFLPLQLAECLQRSLKFQFESIVVLSA